MAPPSGHPPPTTGLLGEGVEVPLVPLAQETCRRYQAEFPDERERYGDAGTAWCVHDNQHLLFWGAGAVDGWVDMDREVSWLADVLAARGFPLDRLARNLDLAAEVVLEEVSTELGRLWAGVLAAAATSVRLRLRAGHKPG
ncbi:MAG: hypothetical protein AVDCRST_MAG32-1864 [uncultured Nocardioides sp.]|uniref:Uncharacterized protein n=1 Tax=uncultured Nocardioides sp. TaxID=198441 RepID=A0A6J4NGZ2_9ACTN|nr:MAG: hypothetical protein AVDCRST_MAG32-1864 [uncultured Nocardioides sp.]